MKKIQNILAIAVVLALLVPSVAFAASSTEAYSGDNSVVAGLTDSNGGGGGGAANASNSSPSLPFTGADLGVLAGAGGLLVLMGFGLRRLTHRPTQA